MGTEPDPESEYIFQNRIGSGFEFLGKTGTGFGMNGMVYRMYVKAWQRWARSRIRNLKFRGEPDPDSDPKS